MTNACAHCGAIDHRYFPPSLRRTYCSPRCGFRARSGRAEGKRFWRVFDLVAQSDRGACIEWPGTRTHFGHGIVGAPRDCKGKVYAHRLAYEMFVGPIPDGMFVCHHCDNPPCCNPDHLFIGRHADNSADMKAKGRQARGSRQHKAKLTEEAVAAIRSSDGSDRALASLYGVTPQNIMAVRKGLTWRHIL
jgi:hypothetical protein